MKSTKNLILNFISWRRRNKKVNSERTKYVFCSGQTLYLDRWYRSPIALTQEALDRRRGPPARSSSSQLIGGTTEVSGTYEVRLCSRIFKYTAWLPWFVKRTTVWNICFLKTDRTQMYKKSWMPQQELRDKVRPKHVTMATT